MPDRLIDIQADVRRGLIFIGQARYLLDRLAKAEAVIECYNTAPRWPTPTTLSEALATWQATQREEG